MAEFYETLGDDAGLGAGEADDADATPSGWGGDGDDGVFFKLGYGELGHGKSGADFLMVTGEKLLARWRGVFAGVFGKSGVHNVVF